MNSTIFVQSSIGIPAGPLAGNDSTGKSDAKPKPIAAVIRPVPRKSETGESERLDNAKPSASQVEKPHIRTDHFEEYVNWLRERIEAERDGQAEAKNSTESTPPASIATHSSVHEMVETSLDSESNVASNTDNDFTDSDSFFSTITTDADLIQKLANLPVDMQVNCGVDDPSIDAPVVESESGHESVAGSFEPNEVERSNLESSNLESSNLESSNLESSNLESESSGNVSPVQLTPTEITKGQGFSTVRFERADDAHDLEDGMPQAHVSFDESTMAKTRQDRTLPVSHMSPADTEAFIATISKAIASVLTEKPEPQLEQQVREHFKSEIQARLIQSMTDHVSNAPTELVDHPLADPAPVDATPVDATPVDAAPDLSIAGTLNPLESQLSPSSIVANEDNNDVANEGSGETLNSQEIPTTVAAWDVEDFRWPVVTNQMIVSGGRAIDQLSRSTFEMISPKRQRVAISGLGRGEGTSSIAISLARWVAATGKKVLLVDADIASPGLSAQVGLAPNLSWVNAISQSLSPAEVIVRSQKSNICVMPMAKMISRVTWPRFIYDSLGQLIDQVRGHFDLVVMDVGPASQLLAELSHPQQLVDATLLVHDGVVSPEFSSTKTKLETFGINRFIVAQNRAPQQSINVA